MSDDEYKAGLDSVPRSGYLHLLHNDSVLTPEQVSAWKKYKQTAIDHTIPAAMNNQHPYDASAGPLQPMIIQSFHIHGEMNTDALQALVLSLIDKRSKQANDDHPQG